MLPDDLRSIPCTQQTNQSQEKPSANHLGMTMNSEVSKWFADFIVLLFIVGLLKSLSTSVEVDNWDADFNSVEVDIRFTGFSSNSVYLKSTMVADFSSGELGSWFAEFALKFIIPIRL